MELANGSLDEIRAMSPALLQAQVISNNGGIHTLEELQRIGVTDDNVTALLDSLKQVMFVIAEEQQKRGVPVTGIENTHDYEDSVLAQERLLESKGIPT